MARTYRRRKMRITMRAGVKCAALLGKTGKECGRECEGPACGRHLRAHVRDNPSVKLNVVDNAETNAMVQILDKMRTEKDVLNNAFVEMFVSREIFNPAENVNKFVTGGIVEDVITELISKLGYPTKNVAAVKTVIDIEIDVPKETGETTTLGVSLKNSGGIDQQPILENYRGESKMEIRDLPPTLIIYTETKIKRARIVYIDHSILRQAYPELSAEDFNATVYNKKTEGDKQSNLSFKSGFLKKFIPRLPDAYIVNATFPDTIPKVEKKSITLLALEYVRNAMKHTSEDQVPVASE